MGKKKNNQKGGGNKAKTAKNFNQSKNLPNERKASETTVEPGFTEVVKRRKRLPRACKKNENEELFRELGLEVRKMNGDGNCLFRAFSDQLEGSEKEHLAYRKTIVQHLVLHKDDFAGFHEQEEEKSFDIRLKKLAKSGSYGGQECLVAFARIFRRVVFIHQPDDKITLQLPPCQSPDLRKYKQVHIVYTGGNHYDSIRLLGDSASTPAAVLFTTDENGVGSYSVDRRPDTVVHDPIPAVFRENGDFIFGDDTVDAEDETVDVEDDAEKDSAIGSECSGSVSSVTSGLSESENPENIVPAVRDSPGWFHGVPADELFPNELSPINPSLDVAQNHILLPDSAVPEVLTEVLVSAVADDEAVKSAPPQDAPPSASGLSFSPDKRSKPLSKAQKRALKKQRMNAPLESTPVPSKSPESVATLTSTFSHLRITTPRMVSV